MKDLETLLYEVEKIAKNRGNGHYTIFKFTTHYKGAFGTPSRVGIQMKHLPAFNTLRELLTWMINEQVDYWDIEADNIPGFRIAGDIYLKDE